MRLPAARNSLSVHIYTICMEREFLIMEITEYIKPELIVVALAAFTAVTQGIVVTGVSVYAKQIIGKIGKK